MKIPNILIIGAGQVGSSVAKHVLACNAAHVVLYDVRPGVAEGMALDLSHCLFHMDQCGCDGTSHLDEGLEGADMVVFAAGAPRHKDQKRIDLLFENARIALEVADSVRLKGSSLPLFIITNPVDVLSTAVKRAFPELHVIGMGCGLDTMRFRYYIAKHLGLPVGTVDAFIAGAHDETMLPLWETAKVGTLPLMDILKEPDRSRILELTRSAGDRIVQSLGRGSSMAAGVLSAQIIHSYFSLDGVIYSVDTFLEDCFGVRDCMVSIPGMFVNGAVYPAKTEFSLENMEKLAAISHKIDVHSQMILNEMTR